MFSAHVNPATLEALPVVPALILAAGLWLSYLAIVRVSK